MHVEDLVIKNLVLPQDGSLKGKNGKVLVIGGSQLFHVAPFWSAAACSYIVDMVHFSSPYLLNNQLMEKKAKESFWNGIVVPWEEIDHYINEDDVILIGPGMERGEFSKRLINEMLSKYPHKKWVIDGGALQEVDPVRLTPSMIVTPNVKEWDILKAKGFDKRGVTTLAKGEVDRIYHKDDVYEVRGGNAGMIKGGTGDVLSGMVAGLYAKNDSLTACYTSSVVNKKIGEKLFQKSGPFFETGEMLPLVGQTLWEVVKN